MLIHSLCQCQIHENMKISRYQSKFLYHGYEKKKKQKKSNYASNIAQ